MKHSLMDTGQCSISEILSNYSTFYEIVERNEEEEKYVFSVKGHLYQGRSCMIHGLGEEGQMVYVVMVYDGKRMVAHETFEDWEDRDMWPDYRIAEKIWNMVHANYPKNKEIILHPTGAP